MGLFSYLKSTLLSKVVMAVTGAMLVLFLIGHTIGNMQVYLGKEIFNHYADMLQSLGEYLWIIRGTLLLAVILHIITSLRLKFYNDAAKPIKYQVKQYAKAKLTSRTMFWTGIMIFAFITYHILHLTAGVTNPDQYNHEEYYTKSTFTTNDIASVKDDMQQEIASGNATVVYKRHDAYKMLVLGFRNPFISMIYIIGMIILGFHLNHAIQSMFQTLSLSGPRFTPWMQRCSTWVSTIIVLSMISLPITIFLRLVGGSV
jgi:succinate dehydrogenase / fumarate reductase, cytochrome b subunit